MPVFTIIKNGQLGRVVVKADKNIDDVIYTAYQQVLDEIVEGETWLTGAYSKDFYKLVEGQPVELTDTELSAPRIKPNKPGADALVDILAADLKTAGIATVSTLPPNADWTKDDAINAINQAAGRVRTRNVSPGNLLVMEYERLIIEVRYWIAAGRDANNVPRMLNSYATNYGHTPSAAADIIVAASDAYDDLLYVTYDKRHEGAAAVDAAQIDFAGVAQPFINYLDCI
jgi:hypothetical protein